MPVAATERVVVPPALIVVDDGSEEISGAAQPDCVTEIDTPATVIVAVRVLPVFFATVKVTAPLPPPLAPESSVIHGAFVDADHAQPALLVTLMIPLPPVVSNVNEDGLAAKLQTVTVAATLSAMPHAFVTRTQ